MSVSSFIGLLETCKGGQCTLNQKADGEVVVITPCDFDGDPVCEYHISGSTCHPDHKVCLCPDGKSLIGGRCIVDKDQWPNG